MTLLAFAQAVQAVQVVQVQEVLGVAQLAPVPVQVLVAKQPE